MDCLSQEECRIVEEEYKIKARTICPSMFGVSKVDFKPDRDVILAPDKNAHFQVILDKIIEMLRVDRPVIVYFDSATTLKSFYSKYENQLETITVNIVDENTTNIDFFVNKATESRIVTLLTRSFGRGLDFQSRDEAVETAGGVGVLQTFFSLYLSEQIQTKGRTGRQTKKGTFQIILEATSLAKQLERPVEEIINAGKSESFYQTISTYRETLVTKHIQSLRTRSADARRVHQESVAFLRKLRTGIPVSDAIRAMTTFQGTQTVSNGAATVHNIFCLDASGSMRDSWNDVAQAVNQFLAVRKELGGAAGDLVTVLQFSTAPKFILEHVNLEQALKTNLSNTCRGETNYVPALLKCLEVIQNDRSGLEPVIVFMTDGAPTDNNKEEIVPSVRQLKDAAPNLQFFCVAFNCGLGGHLEEMTNAIDGRPVSAQGVDQLKNEFKTIARQVSAKHGKRK